MAEIYLPNFLRKRVLDTSSFLVQLGVSEFIRDNLLPAADEAAARAALEAAGINVENSFTARQHFKNTTTQQVSVADWGDFSANAAGHVLVANNAYTRDSDNTVRYSNTHASLGARGIRMRVGTGFEFFDQGAVAATEDASFTPTVVAILSPTGAFNTIGAITQNSVAVVTVSGTQTLTNKTYSGGTISGTITNSGTISGGTVNATTLQQGGVQAVTISGTQTLTNKTYSGGTISGTITNSGTISGGTVNATTLQKGGSTAIAQSDAATQAQQEAGSATTVYTSPGRQHFHPSAAKAWVDFNAAGGINASYNVSSVTDNGTGSFTVNFTTSFSGNYSPAGSCRGQNDTDNNSTILGHGAKAVGSCPIFVKNSVNALVDSNDMSVHFFGDQ